MTFTLSIFLYAYYAFVGIWLLFSLTALYHLLKFGFKGGVTFFTACGYVAISGVIILATLSYLEPIDWDTSISVFGNFITFK
ncbi:hypothetical protein HGA34_05695 [Candidatus Falkowbacteria bacterium]|nr:hypothetical protein [Candidatus Falkowbacteria bacterium]